MKIVGATVLLLSVALAPTWTSQRSGVTAQLRGISAVSERIIWASGSRNTVLRSVDGGSTWRVLPNPAADGKALDYRDIDAVGENVAYVLSIGNGSDSRIFKTTNAGESWTTQFTNATADAFFDAMAFWDANNGIAVSDAVNGAFVIVNTRDGGRSWAPVAADRLPAALPNEGAFAASGTNVAVYGSDRVWFGTGAAARARVLRSTDRGRSWQIAETPLRSGPSAGIYSIAFRDAQHGIIVGGDYTKPTEAIDNVAITSDGGKTWRLVKERGLGGFRSVVAYVPKSRASYVAVGPSGADISTDDGRTWTPIEGPGFDTFSFAPGRTIGWGSGARGAIGRLDLKGP
ncbi:MAG TPA: hypothetical protein VFV78_08390 [Vicinamibacterales bacterium]|nr:hypothetical protein [Vicinamibacterales bacterium]